MQEIVLRIVSRRHVPWADTERALDAALRDVLGHGDALGITIQRVDCIASGPSGKLQAITSRCER